jgi:multisubunit Na+/H+ antiporter MnhB subunit
VENGLGCEARECLAWAYVSHIVNSKANTLLHFVSALYVGVMTAFVSVFAPASLMPAGQVYALLIFGCLFVVLDLAAGFNQLRRPPAGKVLSAALHLAFSSTATIVILFDYLLNRTTPFFGWLWRNDYAVFVALAAVRLLAGGFLIGGMQGTDKR